MKKYFDIEIHPCSATNRPTENRNLYFMPEPGEPYPVGPAPITVKAKYWALSNGMSYGGIKGKAIMSDVLITGAEALKIMA